MDQIDLEFCVYKELDIFMKELLIAHVRLEKEGNKERARVVLAQLLLFNEIFKLFQQNSDLDDFRDSLEDYVFEETDRYQEARDNGDRNTATIMLARVRCTRRLLMRLNNSSRMELHAQAMMLTSDAKEKPLEEYENPFADEESWQRVLAIKQAEEFQQGEDIRQINPEHRRLEYEARKLQKEIALRLSQGGRVTEFHKAQQRAADGLFQYFPEPQQWSNLPDFLRDRIEASNLYYAQAREAADHSICCTLIGYLRFFKTLQRRITTILHRREMRRKVKDALTFH